MTKNAYNVLVIVLLALCIVTNVFLPRAQAQTETVPTRNGDTLYIANLDNLAWLQDANNDTAWTDANDYFKQTANIDASTTSSWNSNAGFGPIGTSEISFPFKGIYDGGGYSILSLYENNTSTLGGMFGYTASATLKNIVLVSESITADGSNAYVGGLLAFPDGNGGTTTINKCSTSGTITSSSASNIGGLVGISSSGTTIEDSYSSADVICTSGSTPIGGLVGDNNGLVENCYTIGGNVDGGSNNDVGGVVGSNNNGTVRYCYSANTLSGGNSNYTGGFIGNNYLGSVNNNFWDTDSSGSIGFGAGSYPQTGATGETASNMTTQSTFTNAGWSTATWYMDVGTNNGYPYLSWQNSGGTPLPIQMTSFSAVLLNSDDAELSWSTATEVQNAGWEVERKIVNGSWKMEGGANPQSSISNRQWTKVGFISGAGASNSPKNYSFTDMKLAPGQYAYRLKQINKDGTYKYSQEAEIAVEAPHVFALEQNYPNPFNPATRIQYSVAGTQKVMLKVYDVLGREVATLVNELQSPGTYEVNFDGSKLASGIYYYRLQSGNNVAAKKMLMIK